MCSNNDDGEREMTPSIETANLAEDSLPGVCHKCAREVECVYKLSFRQAECCECFLAYVTHKFRAALGSSKLLPRDAKVLCVFDGSAEAVTLLDMLHQAQTLNTYKRLQCEAKVLYIAEGSVEAMRSSCEFLSKHYSQLDCHIAPLQETKGELKLLAVREYSAAMSLPEVEVTALRSRTSREDYVQQLRNRVAAEAAAQLGCGFAFFPDISSTVATQLLTAVALGRGGGAALQLALSDKRFVPEYNVLLLRPIRDLTPPEVQLYLRARALQPPVQPSEETSARASLQSLTSAFVAGLQSNYSGSVSTIFRTGNKIAANFSESEECCSFCREPLTVKPSPTLLAIEFSRFASAAGRSLEASEFVQQLPEEQAGGVCHACENLQKDAANKTLPFT